MHGNLFFFRRQARCLLTNIRMLPQHYRPTPPPDNDEALNKPYHYYHKADQNMLVPVKRSAYTTDFYKGYNIAYFGSAIYELVVFPFIEYSVC